MTPKVILISVFVTLYSFSSAQDSLKVFRARNVIPRHSVKLSPFHLLGFYPTAQVAYEVKVAPLWTMQFDLGVVLDLGEFDPEFENKRGVKVKLEPHYYFALNERRRIGFYGALELYQNYVNFERTSWEVECFDADCTTRFKHMYRYSMTYQERGFAFKVGMAKHFPPFMFDVSSGFGFRYINYSSPPYTNISVEFVDEGDEWFPIPNEEDRVAFQPVINFRLGYSFWGKTKL
jgi:hypothetical protein